MVSQKAVFVAMMLVATAGCTDPKADSGQDTGSNDGAASGDGAGSTDSSDGEAPGMEGMVAAHNAVRATVGVPDVVWDDDLAAVALEWATGLAETGCLMEHDYSSPYGENLYWSSYESSVQQVVDGWASEVDYYDYASNSCASGEQCGHYTQLVWDSTQRVGCAMVVCPGGAGEIWMCDYDPPGNWVGEKPY